MCVETLGRAPCYEVWRTCTAAGLDPDGEIEDLMYRMAELPEKAIPMVTVAAQLVLVEPTGSCQCYALQQETGKLACGLLLPQGTGLGFHLNGYFDIDQSRT